MKNFAGIKYRGWRKFFISRELNFADDPRPKLQNPQNLVPVKISSIKVPAKQDILFWHFFSLRIKENNFVYLGSQNTTVYEMLMLQRVSGESPF